MALRITPVRPIERGGLKGFGLSVFIDNSPETASSSRLHTSPETGSAGAPSPTCGQMDLAEAGTGQKRAVLPQEPCTATILNSSADILPSETDKAEAPITSPDASATPFPQRGEA